MVWNAKTRQCAIMRKNYRMLKNNFVVQWGFHSFSTHVAACVQREAREHSTATAGNHAGPKNHSWVEGVRGEGQKGARKRGTDVRQW